MFWLSANCVVRWGPPFLVLILAANAWHPSSTTITTSFRRQQQQHSSSSSSWKKSNWRLYYENNNDRKRKTEGLNELHTELRDAVEEQDFMEAGRISDLLAQRMDPDYAELNSDEKRARRRRMSWTGLGAAPWLTDRLDSLNYTFPTTIQINAMEAVNAILNSTSTEDVEGTSLEERVSMMNGNKDMGIVVSGATGSGKTLSYACPLLSTLSDSLFLRQRLRISDEEAVGDTAGDLVDRISVVTSPRLTSSSRKQTRQKGAIATGASISTLGRSGKDVKSPLALVVVPTRELGVQTAMLLYQLVGGNIKESATERSGKANMFKYKGPKGIRIGCVLDDEEASFGLKLQTDIAITTPQYLGKLLDDGDVDPSKLRVVVFDEADLALEETSADDLSRLFDDNAEEREFSRLTFLVGASVTEALGNLAVSSRVLPKGKSYIVTATSFAPLKSDDAPARDAAQIVGAQPKTASLKDLDVCLYPGLKHERVVISNETGLLALTRLLRKELQDYEEAVEGGAASKLYNARGSWSFFQTRNRQKQRLNHSETPCGETTCSACSYPRRA